jgi:hypothetical protein
LGLKPKIVQVNRRRRRRDAEQINQTKTTSGIAFGVLNDSPITGKTDGVVAYESAHIDGVESEKVVRSGHSTQGHPETIEEVRRILREHLSGPSSGKP